MLPFQVHDVLMVEVLDRPQQVFAIAKWDLTLTFVVTADALPNVCQHELLLFLGNWADEAELQEKLRHLSATNLDFRLVGVGVLRQMHNL